MRTLKTTRIGDKRRISCSIGDSDKEESSPIPKFIPISQMELLKKPSKIEQGGNDMISHDEASNDENRNESSA